jgi:hypothetical protein
MPFDLDRQDYLQHLHDIQQHLAWIVSVKILLNQKSAGSCLEQPKLHVVLQYISYVLANFHLYRFQTIIIGSPDIYIE